jgi:hypothetical protein
MNKQSGYVLHQTIINNEPIVVIATMESDNPKTGNMVQIWFLLENHAPHHAVKSGLDAKTVCIDCPFASGQGCYVRTYQAPLSIWKAWKRGNYASLAPHQYADVFTGRKIRFGAYGNPSIMPISMVKAIASVSTGWTGYFHDWKTNPYANEYAKYFMASTETESSYRLAKSLNYRVFHVSPVKPEGMQECLNTLQNTACVKCNLCNGLTKSRAPSIWIDPHGSGKSKAVAVALSSVN